MIATGIEDDEGGDVAATQQSSAAAAADAYSDSDEMSARAAIGGTVTPARSKSEVESTQARRMTTDRSRSPSPTGSVDPIIARERKEKQQQKQSGVSRVLSSATRKRDFATGAVVGGEKGYELGRMQR